jgi:hypothetical protein
MFTPGHAVLNLTVLGRRRRPDLVAPVLIGAVLPDLPMFLFYFWDRAVLRVPEVVIWSERYFESGWWQTLIDLCHSLPLGLALLTVASFGHAPRVAAGAASMLLHSLVDLAVHHEDAHRHLFPLSNWRFASPVSYWDPHHYGAVAAGGEWFVVVVGSAVLWRRYPHRAGRVALVLVNALYAAACSAFYLHAHRPLV